MAGFLYGVKRALFRFSPRWAARLGVAFVLDTPGRAFLETGIFDYINRRAQPGARCLLVGVDRHNWHYARLLRPELHTLDGIPARAVYGVPGRHRVGSVLRMARYYAPHAFDFVIIDRVLGQGVNSREEAAHMLRQACEVMKPGGVLVLGYQDTPRRAPVPVELGEGFEAVVPAIDGVNAPWHRVDDACPLVYLFARKRHV
ncbi:hypothetical protein [Bordetella genomosp. 1]|uniref:Methyltransferase n=1 Tax=Bordetella genomosp. 1 TaxID=1395607 RepID=A0ABX4F1R2_9BORD|nr:hypothetical protein [Bordetella genomosp. 1]OZI65943.1 hypothetical protein CAL27_13225 [Bordetella genomosp. 1]